MMIRCARGEDEGQVTKGAECNGKSARFNCAREKSFRTKAEEHAGDADRSGRSAAPTCTAASTR